MRLELFDVSRRWPRRRTQRDDERGSVHSEILFTAFCSIRRPYITFKLPCGDMDTPPQFLPISGDRDVSLPLSLEWPVWSSSSGNNCHAVHRSLSSGASHWVGLSPCPILSAEHTCAISFDYWPLGCVTSAIFGMAGVIVIERK